jgi:hypothetical protein
MTQRPGQPSTAASPLQPSAPSDGGPASAMVLTRSGGIAGFVDTVQIAEDGTAQITSKNGQTYACTPDPAALDRLRAIDLAAVGSGPPKSPIADGFTYSVSWAGGSAMAGDGDTEGIRAEFVAAAAAVVSSCQADQSPASPPAQ